MLTILPRMGPLKSNWTTYFTVADAQASVTEAEARGGTVTMPMRESPTGDRFARLESPQGVPFAIIEHSESRG
jgi:predicted enzyme related to lactoylglutathione lyase